MQAKAPAKVAAKPKATPKATPMAGECSNLVEHAGQSAQDACLKCQGKLLVHNMTICQGLPRSMAAVPSCAA